MPRPPVVFEGTIDAEDVRSPSDGKFRVGGLSLSCGVRLDVFDGEAGWIAGRVEHKMPRGYYWLLPLGTGSGTVNVTVWLGDLAAAGVRCRVQR